MKNRNSKEKTLKWQQKVAYCLLFFGLTFNSFAQNSIKGKVTDENSLPVIGVNVIVKGTKSSTTTDMDGNYTINSLKTGSYKVLFTYIGFSDHELNVTVPRSGALNVKLKETSNDLNEVVVTGVFDKRKRIDASIAISTISAAEMRQLAPVSAADLLKNVPGVYVNSSTGEVGNQVTVRGTPTENRSSGGGASGYFYVSLQEDGLPVTNITGGGFDPDFFLRADINTRKVEALRGGSASITGSDAPGGLFNYVSKEGGKTFGGEAIFKYGLEGNANPYYKTDLGFGGPLNAKGDLRYYIGGFYRYSDGARYPGYPMNKGGQVKANIVKDLKGGKLKLYAKYVNDRNGIFDFLPYTNFNNPRIASGFKNTDTFVGSGDATFDFQYYPDGPVQHFKPKNLIENRDFAIGLSWDKDLGKGWTVDNNFKYSSKSSQWNMQYVLGTGTADVDETGYPGIWGNISPNSLFGQPRLGTLDVKDALTGELYYQSEQTQPGVFNELYNNLPNGGYIFGMGNAMNAKVDEIMEQFAIHKSIGKTNFTLGAYYGRAKIDHTGGFAGQYLSTLENRPSPLVATITAPDGNVTTITTPLGYKNNGIFYANNKLTNNRFDIFFGQTSPLTEKLTLDYGFRYNYSQFVGDAEAQSTSSLNFPLLLAGGYDGDSSTEYDNLALNPTEPWSYDRKYKSLSFSGALNYKFDDNHAIYGRYSIGKKAPDMTRILQPRDKVTSDFLYLEPIHMNQIEIGFKYLSNKANFYFTPYYSKISNLGETALGKDLTPNSFYNAPIVYSSQRTFGIEAEGDITLTDYFNLRGNLTLQDPKSIVRRFWDVGQDGMDDDVVIEIKDASIPLTPKVLASITPGYTGKVISASATWRYVGKSPANANGAFDMAAYGQVDFRAGYNISSNLSLTFNANNVFNKLGVTGWYPPGGFPASTMPDTFTKEQREANPNAVWGARTTQPSSFFLTLGYKF